MPLLLSPQTTYKGTFRAQGQWPTIQYQFRVATYEEVETFINAARPTSKESAKLMADFLHKHLVGWDAKDDPKDADTITITPDALRRLPHPILVALSNAVQGYGPAPEKVEE